jgi:hypothetical protein
VIRFETTPDGEVKQVEAALSFEEYRKLQQGRARRAAAQPGTSDIEQTQQAVYLGRGGPGCSGSDCQNPNYICDYNDAIWVYNLPYGWNIGEDQIDQLVIGCFRYPAWDYLPSYWQNNVRSLWPGDLGGDIRRHSNDSVVVSFRAWTQVGSVSGLSGADWMRTTGHGAITVTTWLDSPSSSCGSTTIRVSRGGSSVTAQRSVTGSYSSTQRRCTYRATFWNMPAGYYDIRTSYPSCVRSGYLSPPTALNVSISPTCQ